MGKGQTRRSWTEPRNAYVMDEAQSIVSISKAFKIPEGTVRGAFVRQEWTRLRNEHKLKQAQLTEQELAKRRAERILAAEDAQMGDATLLRDKGRHRLEMKAGITSAAHAIRAVEVAAEIERKALGIERGADVSVNLTQQNLTIGSDLKGIEEEFLRRLARRIPSAGPG